RLPNETIRNIFKYIMRHIMLFVGIFCFLKGFAGFFIGAKRLYLYTFPLTLIVGIAIIFFFICMLFKTVHICCFYYSHFAWFFLIFCLFFYWCKTTIFIYFPAYFNRRYCYHIFLYLDVI